MKKVDFFDHIKARPETAKTFFSQPPSLTIGKEAVKDETDELLRPMKGIEKLLRTFYHEEKEHEIREARELKWKYSSIVLDTFFFYLSSIYFLVTFVPLIFSMVNFYHPD